VNPRITPDDIQSLPPNAVYVYPSNLAGRNTSIYAKLAELRFGAKYGKFYGASGQSFAITIIDKDMHEKLSLAKISRYIAKFIDEALEHSHKTYYCVGFDSGGIGCWPIWALAPLFMGCIDIPNIYLPRKIWESMNEEVQ